MEIRELTVVVAVGFIDLAVFAIAWPGGECLFAMLIPVGVSSSSRA
jgi:hypothetical protein